MAYPQDYMISFYVEEKRKEAKLRRAEAELAAQEAAKASNMLLTPSSTASSTPLTTRPSTPASAAVQQNQTQPVTQSITNGLFGSIYHSLSRVAAFDNDKQVEMKFGLKAPTAEELEAERLKAKQRQRDMDLCFARPW